MQERALRAGVDIIVATPGRLIDHLRQQNADLSGVELLVLDEADRMMDMGFWPDVRRIISAIPNARQTLLFSATMPDDVVRFALEIVREPTYHPGRPAKRAAQVDHAPGRGDAVVGKARLADRTTCAARTVRRWSSRARRSAPSGWRASSRRPASVRPRCTPTGRRSSGARPSKDSAADDTRCWSPPTSPPAASTSTASARSSITSCPTRPNAYVHRVGRTGRADEVGQAITLVAPEERARRTGSRIAGKVRRRSSRIEDSDV